MESENWVNKSDEKWIKYVQVYNRNTRIYAQLDKFYTLAGLRMQMEQRGGKRPRRVNGLMNGKTPFPTP